METQVATKEQFSLETLDTYLTAIGLAKSLSPEQKTQFIELAKAYNLNPFKREIYAIKYGDKFSLVIGYEVYLKRAEETRDLSGWSTHFELEGGDLKCIITIHRKSWSHPFVHDVCLSEYKQKGLWETKPKTMLRKVAICQGFRMAFPDTLGGMPYGEEELPNAREIVDLGHADVVKEDPLSAENEIISLISSATTENEANAIIERLRDSKLTAAKQKQLFGSLQAAVAGYEIEYDSTKKIFFTATIEPA